MTPTLTPIQTDTTRKGNSFLDDTVEQAQANALFTVQKQAADFNAALKTGYLTQFGRWADQVTAGRLDNSNPPQPPKGYVVAYFDDPTTGPGTDGAYPTRKIQWPYPAIGTAPVCDMPPVPGVVHHDLGKALIGNRISGTQYFQCLEGDTTPDGTPVPGVSKDGVAGLYQKIGSPFGTDVNTGAIGGWWLKIG